MNKLIFSGGIIILLYQSLFSQCSAWNVQREGGDGHGYYDMQFIDSLHGWIGRTELQGDNSLLLRTTDGGKSWEKPIIEDGYGRFTSISFIDSLNGWGGADWQLLRTRDGGKTWKIIHELPWLGLRPTFAEIYFADSLHGWGAGYDTNGVNATRVFRTTDGGKSWNNQQLLNYNVYYKIHFLDSLRGWMVGNQIVHTYDGGKTWQTQIAQISTISGISFPDSVHGWVSVQDNATILRTSNSGKTWETLGKIDSADADLHASSISFLDTLNGWMFGATFYLGGIVEAIYKTTDGGVNWKRQSLNLSAYLETGIAKDQCHVWALASDGTVLTLDNTNDVKNVELTVPETVILSQNYPNPFNPTTTITFSLKDPNNAKLIIYDYIGREVTTLLDEYKNEGTHTLRFDASKVSSGMYFYKLVSGNNVATRKMLYLK